MSRDPTEKSYTDLKQRQVCILERHPTIPQRPPQQFPRTRRNLAGHGDKHAFIRFKMRGIFYGEKLARYPHVQEQKQYWQQEPCRDVEPTG